MGAGAEGGSGSQGPPLPFLWALLGYLGAGAPRERWPSVSCKSSPGSWWYAKLRMLRALPFPRRAGCTAPRSAWERVWLPPSALPELGAGWAQAGLPWGSCWARPTGHEAPGPLHRWGVCSQLPSVALTAYSERCRMRDSWRGWTFGTRGPTWSLRSFCVAEFS